MASTIAAVTTSGGGVVTTADASGNLNLLAGTTTVVALTTAGAAITGTLSATGTTKIGTTGTNGVLDLARTSDGATISTFKTDGTSGIINSAISTTFQINTAEAMRINSSGNVGIGVTSPACILDISGATGGQIKFPATQNASSDANTLDDYEEGTFTPTFTSGAGSFTTTSVTGNYTKVGRFVSINMTFTITTVGTASGSLTYSGLPFANGNSARAINVVRENGTTGIMGQTWIDGSTTTGVVRRYDDVTYTLASGQNYLLTLNYYTT